MGGLGYWMVVLSSRGVSGIWVGVGGCSSWFAGRGVGGRVDEWMSGWTGEEVGMRVEE